MEEGIKAAVGIQAVLQIAPALDGMHGLVGHDLFQHQGRGSPGDALQLQEADVEPGVQQVLEIAFQGRHGRIVARQRQQLGPQIDQELHAFGQGVELGQQALAGAFQGIAQGMFGPIAGGDVGGGGDGGHGAIDAGGVGAEFIGQHMQEALAALGVQTEVGPPQGGGAGAGRDFAAFFVQTVAHLAAQDLGVVGMQLGRDSFRGRADGGGDIAPQAAQILQPVEKTGLRRDDRCGCGCFCCCFHMSLLNLTSTLL